MLTDIWYQIIAYLLGLFAKWSPNWAIPDFVISSLDTVRDLILSFDGIFPVVEILQSMTIIFVFEITLYSVKIISGALSLIRGSGKIDIENN